MSHYNQKGFTIIELTLSMGFVASLLIAITLTVIQIGNSYTRGLTLKEVNQAGSALSVDLTRNISQTNSFDLSSSFIEQGPSLDFWGGRLCAGQYSYVWNYGKAVSPDINEYDGSTTKINFVRVEDSAGLMCQHVSGVYPDVPFGKSTELINPGTKNLAIHKFNISSPAEDTTTGQQLYNIKFMIGTNDKDLINTSNNTCKAPGEAGSSKKDFSYCAINVFDIIVRSGNVGV